MNCNCNGTGYNRGTRRCGNCSSGVFAFLVFLFALALGLILGAVFYETLLPTLAALIVFAVIIAVIIIALWIYTRCRND